MFIVCLSTIMTALNVKDASSFPRRQAKLSNGHTYDYVDARPSGAVDNSVPTVLLLHGFPDSWQVDRQQLPQLY